MDIEWARAPPPGTSSASLPPPQVPAWQSPRLPAELGPGMQQGQGLAQDSARCPVISLETSVLCVRHQGAPVPTQPDARQHPASKAYPWAEGLLSPPTSPPALVPTHRLLVPPATEESPGGWGHGRWNG